jgi:hypothetical protein
MVFQGPARAEAILRPFKPLFAYLGELRTRYGNIKRPIIVDKQQVVSELPRSDPAPDTQSDESTETPTQEHDQDEEETREHNKSVTAQAMLDLMLNELKDDTNIHLDCRERKKSLLQFDDAWHLFFPGDIVYRARRVRCMSITSKPWLKRVWNSTNTSSWYTAGTTRTECTTDFLRVYYGSIPHNGRWAISKPIFRLQLSLVHLIHCPPQTETRGASQRKP